MLWFTWALVGLFDVRFVTDSIFGKEITPTTQPMPLFGDCMSSKRWLTHAERIARAIQMAVMLGFAVVAPDFDPWNQIARTFRIMCTPEPIPQYFVLG